MRVNAPTPLTRLAACLLAHRTRESAAHAAEGYVRCACGEYFRKAEDHAEHQANRVLVTQLEAASPQPMILVLGERVDSVRRVKAEALREAETDIAAGWPVQSERESEFLARFCRDLGARASRIENTDERECDPTCVPRLHCSVECEADCGCAPTVTTCIHCQADIKEAPGSSGWVHGHGMSRCQSAAVEYGHLAHPAEIPCPADGPNPCLGASR